jgi:predicted MFS family arabinose efflux permease
MTLSAAGGAVAALGVGGLLYSTNARRVIPRLGERRLLALGGALIAIGYAGVALLARPPVGLATFTAAMGGCGLAGVGFYMLHNTLQTLATQLAPEARATAIGLFAVAIFIGQSVGVALAARIAPAIGHGSVMIAAGLLLAALGIALSRRRAS